METMHPIVGFHCGIGRRGYIGTYMRMLDEAELPFAICSVEDGGLIAEACGFTDADHFICYRPKSDIDGRSLDEPLHTGSSDNYTESAESYYNRVKGKLDTAPEVIANKDRIWIALLNEADQNQSIFLAEMCLELAKLFNDDGWRVVLPNWATGSQYIDDLESPEHIELLRYAGNNRDRCAIGIHEYSLDDYLLNGYPYLTGRWRFYTDVCLENGIPEPFYIAKEFGMHENHALSPEVVIPMLHELMIVDRPDIPRMWWGMQPWHGSITMDTERLVIPITHWIINNRYELDAVPPDVEVEPSPVVPNTYPQEKPGHIGYVGKTFLLYQFLAQYGQIVKITEEWRGEGHNDIYNFQIAVYADRTSRMAAITRLSETNPTYGIPFLVWEKEVDTI